MKIKIISVLFIYFLSLGNSILFQHLQAQNDKKNTVRLSVNYVRIMNEKDFLEIKTISKINKKSTRIPNLELFIHNNIDNQLVLLGKSTTNNDGESNYLLNLKKIKTDSTNTYHLKILFKGNDLFKKTAKKISFKKADIYTRIFTKDSINFITAELKDTSNDSLIEGEPLVVQIKRLFKPLKIGDELMFTNNNGAITVPIEQGIPGVDGNLTIEVVLEEHDNYGTVKASIKAPIGVPIVDESTFDKRTMWSPRSKTPIFLLVIPNILTLGLWGFIIYLIINLFKIQKS